MSERFERLEETLQICGQMWSDDDGPYEGRHYQLAETICSPRPIQQPRPRILIGGMGEQKTLKFVARYADACNLFAVDPAVVSHKIDVLEGHCAAAGRDPAEIEKTIIWGAGDPLDDVAGFLSGMDTYAALGIDQVWVSPIGPDPESWVARFSEQVVPRLAQLRI